ncbi:thiol reductant ABC exporter subunit CydD [Acetobacter conturbans]|uniref:Thiol reductant ABC exporter subunit CydD n=1 Tax=Acetobacter conturbans TaxID=1737472 RepID=A0ABX0K0H7_9PROT|nr:thiol reductant ABC exporter subunit CydD [Acetobacter conturbans]NHN87249.1 thiol reductant ABC exporter subunit CydD [Acetobacter conturbans]
MSESKAAIKAWTRAQARLGLRAARPSIILGIVSCLTGAAQFWCMANILGPTLTDFVTPDGHGAGVPIPLWPLAGFAVAAILRTAINFTSENASATAGRKARSRLRNEVLGSIVGTGPAVLRHAHSGALAALAVDRIEALDGYFARWAPASVLWIAAPAVLVVLTALVQPRAALILALCGATVPFAQALFGIGAAVASRKQFLAMTRLQSRFLDRMRGIATIVLAGRADEEAARLAQAADDLRRRTMKVLRVAFLSSASIDFAMILALILIALSDGRHAQQAIHTTDAASFRALVTDSLFALLIVPEFFAPFRGLALAYQDRALVQGAAEDILALPEVPETGVTEHVRTLRGEAITIAFEDVSFTWDEARGTALEHVSFTARAGETLVLVGPSGSGKSTIMELLLGFIQPTDGRITFNGVDMQSIAPEARSSLISWIGQRPVLFAGSLRENILFAKPDASQEDLAAALRAAAVDNFLTALPDGLETMIGEGGFGLSGGQAQRVAIARAYLKNTPVLLLDEPTAYLDPVTEADVFESLQQLARNRTVILASHSTAVHMFRGQRVDLLQGRVAARQGAA